MADNTLLQYEMMVIVKPDLTLKATKEALATVRNFITEAGGSINHEDIWEKRDLAYMIKGYDEGYYTIMYFSVSPDKLAEIKAELDLEPQILRRMIIKFPTNLTMEEYLDESARVSEAEDVLQEEARIKREEAAAKAPGRSPRRPREEEPKKDDSKDEKTEEKKA